LLRMTKFKGVLSPRIVLLYSKRWAAPRGPLTYVRRTNTVVHATVKESGRSVQRATLLGRRRKQSELFTERMRATAVIDTKTPFSHSKLYTSRGKLLLFETGNMIRAGRHTHADAVVAVLQTLRWAGAPWPTAMAAPNTVCCGQFSTPVPTDVAREHWRTTWTSRFPGIAVPFKELPNVTVQFFGKDSKWVVPGSASPEQLTDAVRHMVRWHADVVQSE